MIQRDNAHNTPIQGDLRADAAKERIRYGKLPSCKF